VEGVTYEPGKAPLQLYNYFGGRESANASTVSTSDSILIIVHMQFQLQVFMCLTGVARVVAEGQGLIPSE
jgi:hypothetical protein